jgi:glutamate 5-kinase
MPSPRARLHRCRRPVIKVGSAVLAGPARSRPDPLAPAPSAQIAARIAALCDDVAALAHGPGPAPAHRTPTLVTSGAVALGVQRLGLSSRPREMALKQAAAAAGQSRLMRLYDDAFEARGLISAQVLLTHADIAHRGRYLNARRALGELLSRGLVPIINENDTVSVEEIKFGDNDALAALVVDLVEADLLVILTDAGGVFTADPRRNPRAMRLPVIDRVTPAIEALAEERGGAEHGSHPAQEGVGTGGMRSKLRAARRASEAGVPCAIVPGEPGVLLRLLAGEDVGTLVLPQGERRRRRQRWMLDLKPRGELRVDDGARAALLHGGKSLLPSGVRDVIGAFSAGDPVDVCALDGAPFARGLCVYGADQVRRIRGLSSSRIEPTLGFRLQDCVVHRDDLVMME